MNILYEIKKQKPLIFNISNYVTMDFVANTLLALGAAPIMSECEQEFSELISVANAVVINIGTLSETFITRARSAIMLAKQFRKPIILDPVGCGASALRTNIAREFASQANIIRANASETIALQQQEKTYGVEALHTAEQAIESAKRLSQQLGITFLITGATDIIIQKERCEISQMGSPLMKHITGMGCALTAVTAAFHAIEPDAFKAAFEAARYYGICGQQAAKQATGPGSFKTIFLDTLYLATTAQGI